MMPRGLALALHSDAPDRLHYALVLAAAAAAIDRPTLLFFTGPSVLLATRFPGWQGIAGAKSFQARCDTAGIAGFSELLEACAALKVERLVCELALSLADINPSQLDDGVTVSGAVTFLTRAKDSEILFV
jgi:predicted peroxiredoxin